MKKAHIIVGCGYGDEGKGVFTDYLSSNLAKPLVIRYNGGHQAGHTVTMRNGQSHVFSNFGAGTFQNIPTYFSNFCTVDPIGIVNEYAALSELNLTPELHIDQMAMVVTPYDQFYNLNSDTKEHGTVGVGFGACVERNLGPCKLYYQDLYHPSIVKNKLRAIQNYYERKYFAEEDFTRIENVRGVDLTLFMDSCEEVLEITSPAIEQKIMASNNFMSLIFEGAQGVLLDMDFGIFPNMTRSNTTSKNAIFLMKRNGIIDKPEVYYLTRCYQTRHGNGYLSSDNYEPVRLINNHNESNKNDGHQGIFRTGLLDISYLNYAIQCDANFSSGANHHTVISCLDQITEYKYIGHDGAVIESSDMESFLNSIRYGKNLYINNSPYSDTIVKSN